jgi:hypothetical protein
MTDQYKGLIQKLDEFIRKYYKNQLLKGLIYSTGLVLLFFISVTVLEYFAHFSTLIRTILFYSFVITSLIILLRFILIPLSKLYRLGQIISHETAATIIGKHFTAVQDKLLNVLQLQHEMNQTSSQNFQSKNKRAETNPIYCCN